MKTIFTFLSALLVSVTLLAADARPKSTLTIKSVDRSDIRVVIDGRRFEPGDNYLRIRSLESGRHTVRIYRQKMNGFFNIFGMRYETVFSSTLHIRPYTNVMISIDRFGRASVSESRMGFERRGNDRDFDNDRSWDNKHDFDFDRSKNNGDYDSRDSRDSRDNRDGRWGQNDRDDRNGRIDDRDRDNYNRSMSDLEFSRVLQSIDREWFDNNKAKSATQIISTSFFTSAQVKQMLQLFTIESNKLDLAKQAYAKTVDQRNYMIVSDVFSFNSSKEELARFIRNAH